MAPIEMSIYLINQVFGVQTVYSDKPIQTCGSNKRPQRVTSNTGDTSCEVGESFQAFGRGFQVEKLHIPPSCANQTLVVPKRTRDTGITCFFL